MAISYNDFKKKYGKEVEEYQNKAFYKKSNNNKKPTISLPMSTDIKVLKSTFDSKRSSFNTSKTKLNTYLKDNGVVTGNNTYSLPTPFTIRTNQAKSGNILKLGDKTNTPTVMKYKDEENVKKYMNMVNTYEGKKLVKDVKSAKNEDALAESNYNVQKGINSYKESGTFKKIGKVLAAPIRGATSVLKLNNNRIYEDPNTGASYKLPSYSEGVDSGISQYGGKIANIVNAVGNQIGKVGASAILNSVVPYLGTAMYNVDIFDNAYNNTLKEGYTQQQATSYALLSTATEFATGKILGSAVGKFQKQGDVENMIGNALKGVIKSEKLNKVVASAISEGNEEFVQEFLDVFERNLTLGEDNKINGETVKNALYSGLVGALSSGASEGARQVMKNGVQAHIDQIAYDIERTNNTTLSDTNKTIIANNVLEQYLNNDGVIDSKQVVDNYMNEKRNKIDALSDSASKYFNTNDSKTVNMLNSLTKFIDDRNYDITFDSSIGDNVNGLIIDGNTIKINPKTDNAIEKIAMHEVTHSISTETMRDLVMDYASKHDDFKEALNSLKKTYKTNDVSDEVLANISGQLFGNQEFINMLKNDEPTTFKKIYNGVMSIANKLTGNSNEFLFTQDLKNKWENAYRNQNIQSNEIKYHVSGNISQNIDNVLSNINERNPVKLRDYTPEILVNYGINNLPMYENPSHIRKNILTVKEAQKLGLSIMPNDNYHGLGKDLYIKAIDSLDNPRAIFKRNNDKDYLILTSIKDNEGNNIIVPIEIETSTNVNNIKIDTNRIKSVYGRKNLDTYIKNNINQNEFSKIYEQKKERGTGTIPAASSFIGNNIPQSNDNVKLPLTTKYSMQNSRNNTTWKKYVEDNYKSRGTTTKSSEIKLPTEKISNKVNLLTPESATNREISIYEKDAIKNKVDKTIRSRRSTTINEATKLGDKYLLFTREEKKSFKDSLDKYVGLTKEELNDVNVVKDIKDIVDRYANKEITYTLTDIDDAKKQIRQYRIIPSENIKKDIPDFNEFRKSNFGKITFSNDGSSIDTVYQELCESYPQYFESDVYSEADMLNRISDFMNLDSKIVETYRLDDEELTKATYRIINELQNNLMSEEEVEKLQKELEDKALVRTREIVQKEYIDEMGITVADLDAGKDISSIDLSRTDPTRVYEKVFGNKVGKKINDAIMYPLKHNEANKIRELNKIRDEVKALGIKPGSDMSAAVQKYAEGSYIDSHGDYQKYDDRNLMNEFPSIEDQEKIKNAAKYFRKMYDEIIDRYNQVMAENAYKPMLKRKNYMKHMIEQTDIFSKLGTPLNPQSMSKDVLPTDINGLTDEFKPGKQWFSGEMKRRGANTIHDAVKGFDQYIEGALNVIYHTEDIQRERALAKQVRDTYGQNMLDSIDTLIKDGVSTSEVKKRVQDIYDNKLSKFAAWQDEQANALAGKKGKMDRWIEEQFGRKVYTVLNTAKEQVGANMTGLNIRSALTNFASVVQGSSKTNKIAFLKGTISTINNIVHKDGLVNKSDFLTSRFGSDRIAKTPWDKISGFGQILMSGTDYFTANQIWRGKYYENLSKGMSEQNAIKKADEFASRVMGDRSAGTTATIFNSKTAGILTQFQLETNNQWSSLLHDNKMALQNGELTIGGLAWQAGQLMALSYMFNNLMSVVTGSNVMIDFVDMFKHIFAPDDDDDKEKSINQRAYESFGSLVNQIPFVSVFTGGRLPIGEAFKGTSTGLKMLTNQKDEYGNDITAKDVSKDMIESAFYWILPTGYSQAKKTYKGLKMYDSKLPLPGSYTESGNLRFNANTSAKGKVKSALFGQYSENEAQKYIDSGYKTINKNHIQEMKDLGMSSSEYREYRTGLNAVGTTNEEKLNYIKNLNNVTMRQKSIMASNVIKKDVDMSEYNKYKSYEEYNYAIKYPNKYLTINQITSYDEYNTYKIEIDSIRKSSNRKKQDVISYVNSLNLNIPQKAMLVKQYYSFDNYNGQIIEYINSQELSKEEKSIILEQLGFTVRNGVVYP